MSFFVADELLFKPEPNGDLTVQSMRCQ
jgi:hypothetical protein